VYRARNPEVTKKVLPLTCDMLVYALNSMFKENTELNICIRTALIVMRSCLLRASETIPCPRLDHHLRSNDIIFEINLKNMLEFRYSFDIEDIEEHQVIGVSVNVRSAKNDQSGCGHKMPFSRDKDCSASFCLTLQLFQYSKHANLKRDQPFFLFQSRWKLSYRMLNKVHKEVAKKLNFDDNLFSCKSSRVGGACALSLAGFPDSYIMKLGRWKSVAFLEYVRLCVTAFTKGLKAISDPTVFTMNDVRKLTPTNVIKRLLK